MTSGLKDAAGFELSASEKDMFFSRFGRRPNRDATNNHIITVINNTDKPAVRVLGKVSHL